MWPDGVLLAGCIRACTYSLTAFILCTERPSPTARKSRQTGVRKSVPARLLRQRLQTVCMIRSKQNICCTSFGCLLLIVDHCIQPIQLHSVIYGWKNDNGIEANVEEDYSLSLGDMLRGPMVSSCGADSSGCRRQRGTAGPSYPDRGGKRRQWRGIACASPWDCSTVENRRGGAGTSTRGATRRAGWCVHFQSDWLSKVLS